MGTKHDFVVKNGLQVGKSLTVDSDVNISGTLNVTGSVTGSYAGFDSDFNAAFTPAFDSAFNAALDSAGVDGTGLSYNSTTNTLSISNTGVTAGTYGSASLVPVLSVNAQGQIDSAGTVSVAGVSSTAFDSASHTLTINTADGGSFDQIVQTKMPGTAGSYGSAALVPVVTVNEYGLVDSINEVSVAGVSTFDFDSATGKLTIGTADGGSFSQVTTLDPFNTGDLIEGSNLYYTTARADSDAKAAISVTDAGGDGSLIYSSGTITYTGPSASEVRAHFTSGTGVDISSGVVSIGQNVDSSSNVIFQSLETTGNVTIGGNLQVNGSTTTVSSQNLQIEDNMFYLNQLESDGSPTILVDVGFAANVNDTGSYAHTGFFRDASDATWKLFDGYTPEPDSDLDIDINHASFSYADLQVADLTAGNITVSGTVDGRDIATDGGKLDGIEAGATADQSASEILTAIKTVDGASSGLDADQLDGLEASQFLRNDANGTSTGSVAFGNVVLDPDSYSTSSGGFGNIQDGGGWAARGLFVTGGTGKAAAIAAGSGQLYLGTQDGSNAGSMATWLQIAQSTKVADFKANPTVNSNAIWHAGNDGSGSGLDADTVDGVQLSGLVQRDFQDTNRNLNIATNSTSSAGLFMKASDGGFRFQIYGDGTNYGFLDGDWAGWDLKKTPNGALYFNDNNSYYLNPPGYSILDRLHVGGSAPYAGGSAVYSDERMSLSVGDAGLEAIVYQSQYNNATYPDYGMVFVHGASGGNRNVWAIAPEGPARGDKLSFLYNLNSTNIHTGTYRFWLDGSGNSYSQTSSRAPIFYDTNNTGHYVDPNGTTNINTLVVAGKADFQGDAAIEGGSGYGVFKGYTANNNHLMTSRGIITGSTSSPTITGGHNQTFVEYVNDDNSGWFFKTSHTGTYTEKISFRQTYNIFQEDVRAPLFYDKDDTAYYADPNGYSRFKSVQAGNQGALNGNTTYAMGLYHNNRYMLGIRNSGADSNYPWLVHDNWNGAAFIVHFNGIGDRLYLSEGGLLESTSEMRSGSFSDRSNTAYYFNGDNTGDSIRVAGDIVAYYSDERLKDFHGRINGALDKVLKINGYYYTENEKAKELGYNTGRTQVGVSAQEIEEVLPEVIKDAPIGHGYKTVQYERLVPLLIEAIKEQNDKIERLEAMVEKLINTNKG